MPRIDVRHLLAAVLVAAPGCAGRPAAAPPPRCGTVPCRWTPLIEAVDSAVRAGAAPGAVVGVSVKGARFFHRAGQLGVDDATPTDLRTVYDLASLTKVVALTTLTMMAVDENRLDLDDPVGAYLPEYRAGLEASVTLRHLLTHSSGLPAHRPLWREAATPEEALRLALTTPLESAPGTRAVYSDVGAIALTRVIEVRYGTRLDRLFAERVADPLGMSSTRFLPPDGWRPRIAPTERDPWRGRLIRGEVHDENAAFLGGVSGHAGLFGDVVDLVTFGEWLLAQRGGRPDRGKPTIQAEVVREFTRRQTLVPGSSRALGWDTPSNGSSAGHRLSPESFGHTGFTGTSIWLDPERELVIVLLSNRVNPTRDNPRLGPLRVLVADRIVSVLESAPR